MYTNKSSQFVRLVKGEYGHTPVKIDPEFRFKICGVREETPYDTSKYKMQPNPELPEAGGVKLAANEKEVLLLELFPLVAKNYLTNTKKKAYEAEQAEKAAQAAQQKAEDTVKIGQSVITLEAMKMENSITTDYAGTVKQILVAEGQAVPADAPMVVVE